MSWRRALPAAADQKSHGKAFGRSLGTRVFRRRKKRLAARNGSAPDQTKDLGGSGNASGVMPDPPITATTSVERPSDGNSHLKRCSQPGRAAAGSPRMTAPTRAALGAFCPCTGSTATDAPLVRSAADDILQRDPVPHRTPGCLLPCFTTVAGRYRVVMTLVRQGSCRHNDEACNHQGQDRQRLRQKHSPVHAGYFTTKRLFRSRPSNIMVPIVGRSRVNAKTPLSSEEHVLDESGNDQGDENEADEMAVAHTPEPSIVHHCRTLHCEALASPIEDPVARTNGEAETGHRPALLKT